MAAGWPTKANYATGDVLTAANMNDLSGTVNYIDPTSATDGQVLTRDAASAGKVKWATPSSGITSAAGKNAVINGGMDIWQRGTSFAGASTGFCADRWRAFRGAAGSTFSRQSSGLTTIQYALRMQRDSGNTATNGISTWYTAESADSYRFAGQAVTLSFYARAGANFSAASNNINVTLQTGTGTDQAYGSFTGSSNIISTTQAITTTWTRYSFTGTFASTATQFAIEVYYNPVGTAGAADYLEITGVQLEIGSSATTFNRNSTTYQGELAACQRYYIRQGGNALYEKFGSGTATGTTAARVMVFLPVTMRVKPTVIEQANLLVTDWGSGAGTTVTMAFENTAPTWVELSIASGGAGLTANRPCALQANNSTSAYLGFGAEL